MNSRIQIVCGVVACLVAACGGSDDPAPLGNPNLPTFVGPSSATCTSLATNAEAAKVLPPNVKVTSAVFAPATAASGNTAALPEHCNLLGTISERTGSESSPGVAQTYAIRWQVRLPTTWNGRFVMEGGGGTDGSIPNTTSRLLDGYAMAANDSGHDNNINNDPLAAGPGTFGTDPEARKNFAYQAIDQTQQVARGLISTYYNKAQDHSYFEGCSMGGREAMMVTQRLPNAFDGVVSGDPGFRFAEMTTHVVYNSQVLGELAKSMNLYSVNGLPLVNNTYTNQDLQMVSKAVLDACDGLDGLVDGMVNKPMQCTEAKVSSALSAKQCAGAKTPTCLTAAQIDTFKKIYAGPVTPSGKRPYTGWMWDAGIAGCSSAVDCNTPTATNIATNWRGWKIGTFSANVAAAINNASDFTGNRGGAAGTVIVPTPPNLPANVAGEGTTKMLMNYDLDEYYASMFRTTTKFPESSWDQLQADSKNLTPFTSHGGKLIIWQPQSGGPFSPLAMVDWYEKLNVAGGGTPFDYSKTQSSVRLFLMPGAHHCGSGPSTSTIDAFNAVVSWVESGTAPDRIIGTAPAATPWPGRTRPLCPYPKAAIYNGTGNIEVAANFTCQ